jgi:hypothetical protein
METADGGKGRRNLYCHLIPPCGRGSDDRLATLKRISNYIRIGLGGLKVPNPVAEAGHFAEDGVDAIRLPYSECHPRFVIGGSNRLL